MAVLASSAAPTPPIKCNAEELNLHGMSSRMTEKRTQVCNSAGEQRSRVRCGKCVSKNVKRTITPTDTGPELVKLLRQEGRRGGKKTQLQKRVMEECWMSLVCTGTKQGGY